eukprot:363600_1
MFCAQLTKIPLKRCIFIGISLPKQMSVISIKRFTTVKPKGNYDAKFNKVAECFESNLNNFLLNHGGALCIYLDNKCVMDIWGGQYSQQNPTEWQKETYTNFFSNAKALGGLCILHQADKGQLSLDDPLCKYWPEFGQNGKDIITVSDVFSHKSGCVITSDVTPNEPPNYNQVIKSLETMKPNFTPKTGVAYHTFTIGYFINEITKRVSNMNALQYFEKYIRKPLGIHETELNFINPMPKSPLYSPLTLDDDLEFCIALNIEELPVAQAWKPYLNLTENTETNNYYNWDIPSTGFGNARGLAKISNKILNNKQHEEIISDTIRKQCLTPVVIDEHCQLLDFQLSLSLSHFACDNNQNKLLNGKGVFSAGIGQSFGFLNEEENIAIGYCPSRAHEGLIPPHTNWIANELFPAIKSVL